MNSGDYVLATKYVDGDPADPWCIGFYIRSTLRGRHLVGDKDNGPGPNGFRFSGFGYVDIIDEELGEWLLRNSAELEKAPPGSINLRQICYNRMKYLVSIGGVGTCGLEVNFS